MKKKRIWNVLFCLYVLVMLWLLFDRDQDGGGLAYWDQVANNLNLRPFHTIGNYMDVLLRKEYYMEKWGGAGVYAYQARHAAINLLGNIVMFVPLGFLLPKVSPRQRKLWRCLLATATIIALVEMAQLFSLRGSCDVDDLILNILGAAIGYCVYKMFHRK